MLEVNFLAAFSEEMTPNRSLGLNPTTGSVVPAGSYRVEAESKMNSYDSRLDYSDKGQGHSVDCRPILTYPPYHPEDSAQTPTLESISKHSVV